MDKVKITSQFRPWAWAVPTCLPHFLPWFPWCCIQFAHPGISNRICSHLPGPQNFLLLLVPCPNTGLCFLRHDNWLILGKQSKLVMKWVRLCSLSRQHITIPGPPWKLCSWKYQSWQNHAQQYQGLLTKRRLKESSTTNKCFNIYFWNTKRKGF